MGMAVQSIHRAANDLPPRWVGRTMFQSAFPVRRPGSAQPVGPRPAGLSESAHASEATFVHKDDQWVSKANDWTGLACALTCGFGARGGIRTHDLLMTRQQTTV
jgi:hypothetical protein